MSILTNRNLKWKLLHFPRFVFNKRSVGSTHSSHGNLSQASIASCDVLSGDEADSPVHRPAKISERMSNSSTDIQGARSAVKDSCVNSKGGTSNNDGFCI